MKNILLLILLSCVLAADCQTIGGNSAAQNPFFSTKLAAVNSTFSGDGFTVIETGARFCIYNGLDICDTATVIQTQSGNKYKIITDGQINIKEFGVKYGQISGAYSVKSGAWSDNWRKVKKAMLYACSNSLQLVASDTIQIKLTGNSQFSIPANKSLQLIGTPGACFDFQPKVKRKSVSDFIYSAYDGQSISIENLSLIGAFFGWSMETNTCTFSPGGNTHKIQVTGTPRIGFFSGLSAGDFIGFQNADSTIYSESTITSFDSVAKTITISATILNTGSGNVFTYFPESIDTNSVKLYGTNVWTNEGGLTMVNANCGQSNYALTGLIRMSNINAYSVNGFISKSGGGQDVLIENCYINAQGVGIADFPGEYPNESKLTVNNSFFYNCGTNENVKTDPVFGHDFYLHPNVPVSVNGNKHFRSKGSPFNMTSDSGGKPPGRFSKSEMQNCFFQNCGEVIRLGGSSTWNISNCGFRFQPIQVGNTTTFNNCDIGQSVTGGLQTKPYNFDSKSTYDITFNSCVFYDSSALFMGWPNGRTAKTRLFISDCTKFLSSSNTPEPFITSYPDGGLKTFVNDLSVYIVPGKVNYQALFSYNQRDTMQFDNVLYSGSYPASSTGYLFGGYAKENTSFVSINNSYIKCKRLSVFDDGYFTPDKMVIKNSNIEAQNSGAEPAKLYSYFQREKYTTTSAGKVNVSSAFDVYHITDSTLITGVNISDFQNPAGAQIKLVAETGFRILRNNNNSNNIICKNCADTLVINRGESVILTGNISVRGSGVYSDSIIIGTGNGVSVDFNTGLTNVLSGFARIPGSLQIKVGNTIAGADNYNNTITGSGIVESAAGYFHGLAWCKLTSAPGVGVPVKLKYNRHTTYYGSVFWTIKQ